MRSVVGVGTWTDDTGKERGAVVGINVGDGVANITVGPILDPQMNELPTRNRHIVYYIGKVEAAIRATEWRNRDFTPDPKPKDSKPPRRVKLVQTSSSDH